MRLAISILACIQIRVREEKKGQEKYSNFFSRCFSFQKEMKVPLILEPFKARLDVIKLFCLFVDSIEGEKDDKETAKQDKYTKLCHGNSVKNIFNLENRGGDEQSN